MATEQQHANGAITPKEWEELRKLLNGDLYLGPFDNSRSLKAFDVILAKRPASYTLEQIMSACETVAAHIPDIRDRSDFRMHLRDVYARLQPTPKPKTVEERVVEVLGKYDIQVEAIRRDDFLAEMRALYGEVRKESA
jgi:hypothetical protein